MQRRRKQRVQLDIRTVVASGNGLARHEFAREAWAKSGHSVSDHFVGILEMVFAESQRAGGFPLPRRAPNHPAEQHSQAIIKDSIGGQWKKYRRSDSGLNTI
jgi:hypothetical protein